jgi:hypothetical protein
MSEVETPVIAPGTAMSRQRAAGIHFLISAVIFAAVILPLLMMWYPPPLFFADGGWNVIQIAGCVDVVIGPVLTLIVFKPGKKNLKLDLAVIASLQFVALAWGVHLMYQERPLFLAYAEGRFGTVARSQVADSKRPLEELLGLGNDNPVRVLVRLPADPAQLRAMRQAQSSHGKSMFSLTDEYEAMTPPSYQYVYSQALDMTDWLKRHPEVKPGYDAFMQKPGAEPKEFAFVPLICRYRNVLLIFRRSDNSIAGSIDIPAANG